MEEDVGEDPEMPFGGGGVFEHVLNFMREVELHYELLSSAELVLLRTEARFYRLHALVNAIDEAATPATVPAAAAAAAPIAAAAPTAEALKPTAAAAATAGGVPDGVLEVGPYYTLDALATTATKIGVKKRIAVVAGPILQAGVPLAVRIIAASMSNIRVGIAPHDIAQKTLDDFQVDRSEWYIDAWSGRLFNSAPNSANGRPPAWQSGKIKAGAVVGVSMNASGQVFFTVDGHPINSEAAAFRLPPDHGPVRLVVMMTQACDQVRLERL
ncbi:hypothetical protein JKP88DRAFT_290788 [Tribonema minus]|uniref:SPRY domain-containing protein n=1 Tax=Tribonema minus TaxID=303371 RepID=A0A835Z3N3_9STRA|nr:hypothetical protein JKP88DRAFT_290788 [Tribonema minus]